MTVKLSQSALGCWFEAVITEIWSPFFKTYLRVSFRLFTNPPTHLLPTLVWIAYAKSSKVAPACRVIKSPFGVNTCTSLSCRLMFISSSRSMAFSSLLSRISRNSFNQFSMMESEDPPLYFQCAANPFSAISSIRSVRIWTSTHRLRGPNTVVCKDS